MEGCVTSKPYDRKVERLLLPPLAVKPDARDTDLSIERREQGRDGHET